MPRYIDADILKALYQPIDGKDYNVNMAIIRANIDDIPTADVQEVRHGKWEEVEENHIFLKYKCSVCGMRAYRNDYLYCHCGAKMDGDSE